MPGGVFGLAVDATIFNLIHVLPITILKTWPAVLGLAPGNRLGGPDLISTIQSNWGRVLDWWPRE
jgi:hypothetical protein